VCVCLHLRLLVEQFGLTVSECNETRWTLDMMMMMMMVIAVLVRPL